MFNAILKFVIICVICGKKFKSECPVYSVFFLGIRQNAIITLPFARKS
jgi:hypothetical protein